MENSLLSDLNEDVVSVEEITNVVRDYIESCYEGDPERMARSLHPALVKRTLMPHEVTNRPMIRVTSASQLIENIRGLGERGHVTPEEERRFDLTILDVFDDVATVKVYADYWLDYIHLIKIDGSWKILNVLWRVYDWSE
jgi:hypothetical protein